MPKTLFFLLTVVVLPLSAADHYAAPAGSAQGDGSIGNPWDLQTALSQPRSVVAGDTIWLRGGTYTGAFVSTLTGAPGSPIIVRQYPGERATLDAATQNASIDTNVHTLNVEGAYTWYWDFEVTNSNPTRQTNVVYNNFRGDGVWVTGPNTKFINLIVHDTDQGFSFWEPATNSDLYGNLDYNNGWSDPTRGRGHGIYAQNQTGTKLLSDNILFAEFDLGIQIYGSGASYLNYFDLEGNISAANGGQNYLVGGQGGTVAQSPILNSNYSYAPVNPNSDGGDGNNIGYSGGCANPVVTNNYFGYGGLRFVSCSNITLSGNTFYGVTDFYGSDEGVYTDASFPNNTYYGVKRPTGVKVFVRPNKYEPGRANIAIFNWDLNNTILADLSGIGLNPGDAYELHNAEDYFGDVVKGTWGDGSLLIQMTGHTVATPVGWTAAPTTFPEFGMFVIRKASGSAPVSPSPSVSAGANQTITLPAGATLNGSASPGTAGAAITVQWSVVSGPGTVTFGSTTTAVTTASFSMAGSYNLKLTATSGGLSASSTTTVTVQPAPQAPTVSAGANQTITLPAGATLNGSASPGTAGAAITVQWSVVSGPGTVTFGSTTTAVTTASFSMAGSYNLKLTATSGGLSASNTTTVTVQPAPQAPTVSAGANQTITLPAGATLNGSASPGTAGAAITVQWSVVSGPGTVTFGSTTTAVTTASFSMAGSYNLKLTATSGGLSASSTTTVTVQAAPQAPTVSAGANQTITLPAGATLNGSASPGTAGAAITVQWSVVSGPGTVTFGSTTTAVTTASFSMAGSYNLKLTATSGGLSASSTTTVTVQAASQAPTVSAGANQTITLPAGATLNGSASAGTAGAAITVQWSVVSGPGTVTFGSTTTAVTTASFSMAGSYNLKLTATSGGLSASSTTTVTVQASPQAPSVSAGANQTITLPASAQLSGTASDASAPPGKLTQAWSVVSGPGSVTFANKNALSTTASFSSPGQYTLSLTANYGTLSASSNVIVTALKPPTVAADQNRTAMLPSSITLNGRAAPGVPGAALTVQWSMLSGPGTVTFGTPNAAVTTASFSLAGIYTLQITATSNGLSASATMLVTAQAPTPVVSAGANQTITLPATANLTGTVTDYGVLPGRITQTWAVFRESNPCTIAFTNPNALNTAVSFSTPGTYTLSLTASNGTQTGIAYVTIKVLP